MSYVVFVLWLPLRFSVHILFFMKSLNGFTYPFFGGASRTHLSCLWFSDILRSIILKPAPHPRGDSHVILRVRTLGHGQCFSKSDLGPAAATSPGICDKCRFSGPPQTCWVGNSGWGPALRVGASPLEMRKLPPVWGPLLQGERRYPPSPPWLGRGRSALWGSGPP